MPLWLWISACLMLPPKAVSRLSGGEVGLGLTASIPGTLYPVTWIASVCSHSALMATAVTDSAFLLLSLVLVG